MSGGSGESNGRVEIFHNGVWGTVCGSSFDMTTAVIVCRQMGYQNARVVRDFGPGKSTIFLHGLSCRSNDSTIFDCPSDGWSNERCAQDVGVDCGSKFIIEINSRLKNNVQTR